MNESRIDDPNSTNLDWDRIISTNQYQLNPNRDGLQSVNSVDMKSRYTLTSLDPTHTWSMDLAEDLEECNQSTYVQRIVRSSKRPFELFMGDTIHIERPCHWWFTETHINDHEGEVGCICKRFSLFKRRYDLFMLGLGVVGYTASVFWRPRTFEVYVQSGQKVADIKQKGSGLFKETLMHADSLIIDVDSALSYDERLMIITLAVCIDFDFFEKRRSSKKSTRSSRL